MSARARAAVVVCAPFVCACAAALAPALAHAQSGDVDPRCAARSRVLVRCDAGPPLSRSPDDAVARELARTREALERRAVRQAERAALSYEATLLAPVIVEGQAEPRETPGATFDRTLAPAPSGRGAPFASSREDRDAFGTRAECRGITPFLCGIVETGRPHREPWHR